MTYLFRIDPGDGRPTLAVGESAEAPIRLLPAEVTLDRLLGGTAESFVATFPEGMGVGPVPRRYIVLPPIESQEVWGSGVTYLRSRDARAEESKLDADVYERVYDAERPELFFKSAGWRARGPGQPIGVRADSAWNAPEPELALILASDMAIVGLTIGNDVSSRSIEGDNPLYLPQAKIYDGSCALGPSILVTDAIPPAIGIHMEIVRDGALSFSAEASTSQMRRSFDELGSYLGRALAFPHGAVLLTGTGIVPPSSFTLRAGDVVRIRMEGLGILENPVVEVG
jgi:2-dehydro-3-deoxy-D-arabinonate dehydratase